MNKKTFLIEENALTLVFGKVASGKTLLAESLAFDAIENTEADIWCFFENVDSSVRVSNLTQESFKKHRMGVRLCPHWTPSDIVACVQGLTVGGAIWIVDFSNYTTESVFEALDAIQEKCHTHKLTAVCILPLSLSSTWDGQYLGRLRQGGSFKSTSLSILDCKIPPLGHLSLRNAFKILSLSIPDRKITIGRIVNKATFSTCLDTEYVHDILSIASN